MLILKIVTPKCSFLVVRNGSKEHLNPIYNMSLWWSLASGREIHTHQAGCVPNSFWETENRVLLTSVFPGGCQKVGVWGRNGNWMKMLEKRARVSQGQETIDNGFCIVGKTTSHREQAKQEKKMSRRGTFGKTLKLGVSWPIPGRVHL